MHGFIDFEKEMLDDFVLETKQIEIPGYPYAFNPSIIRWKSSMLMSFRAGKEARLASGPEADTLLLSFRTRDPINGSTNGIGLILLDEDFNIISEPQILDIPHRNPLFVNRQQDPRLVEVGNRMYIAYSNMVEGVNIPEMRRMFIAELHYDGRRFFTGEPDPLVRFEGENEQRWQKNWVPFDYKGNLMLAYSINPHRILHPFLGTGTCETFATSEAKISWEWGYLRGGTAALRDGDDYLAFFHTSKDLKTAHSEGKKISHYFMGAYTFSGTPPFEIKTISSKPIVGKNFYYGPDYKTWKPLRVVFPCGFVMNKDYVWIAYGRQDHEVWIVKLDKKRLLQSLVPVTTTSSSCLSDDAIGF